MLGKNTLSYKKQSFQVNMSNGTYGTINSYNGTTNIDIAGSSGNERGVYMGYYLSLSTAGVQFGLYAGHWTANAEF